MKELAALNRVSAREKLAAKRRAKQQAKLSAKQKEKNTETLVGNRVMYLQDSGVNISKLQHMGLFCYVCSARSDPEVIEF